MRMHSKILAAVLAAGVGAALVPAISQARVYVDIGVAPPPPPAAYVVPAPRPGFIWAPGYYRWDGYRHVWVGGYWMRARPGYRWVAPGWQPYGARWRYHGGYWAR
jgi:hypothetical protein